MPSTPAAGVRVSCEMLATNSDLSRLASFAAASDANSRVPSSTDRCNADSTERIDVTSVATMTQPAIRRAPWCVSNSGESAIRYVGVGAFSAALGSTCSENSDSW